MVIYQTPNCDITYYNVLNLMLNPKQYIKFYTLQKVNYRGIGESAEFGTYKTLTQELVRVQIEQAAREERLAFFINIYNALVIHANIQRGPPTNLWQRYKVGFRKNSQGTDRQLDTSIGNPSGTFWEALGKLLQKNYRKPFMDHQCFIISFNLKVGLRMHRNSRIAL